MYIYMCMYVCMHIYIYIYICMHTHMHVTFIYTLQYIEHVRAHTQTPGRIISAMCERISIRMMQSTYHIHAHYYSSSSYWSIVYIYIYIYIYISLSLYIYIYIYIYIILRLSEGPKRIRGKEQFSKLVSPLQNGLPRTSYRLARDVGGAN